MIQKRYRIACTLIAAMLCITAMQACSSLGIQQPQTFDERYAYALGQTTALRQAATQGLANKSIGVADAEYVLKLTDQSRQYLDTARQVVTAGDAAKGKTQLELATSILTQLQAYLTARASK